VRKSPWFLKNRSWFVGSNVSPPKCSGKIDRIRTIRRLFRSLGCNPDFLTFLAAGQVPEGHEI
jgi:hypothetical protein